MIVLQIMLIYVAWKMPFIGHTVMLKTYIHEEKQIPMTLFSISVICLCTFANPTLWLFWNCHAVTLHMSRSIICFKTSSKYIWPNSCLTRQFDRCKQCRPRSVYSSSRLCMIRVYNLGHLSPHEWFFLTA